MSFAETRQIMADLQEIMQLLGKATVKMDDAERKLPKTKEAFMSFRELERVSLRFLAVTNRMGLPSDISAAIQQLSRLLIIIRMLHSSYSMLISGPFGVLMGVTGFAMTGFAMYDAMVGT